MSVMTIGKIKLYIADIRDISDSEYQKWYSFMSKEKQQRVDRFRFSDDKKRSVAGEMLARKALSEYCSVSPSDIKFSVGENGKPYAENLTVEFNISHSENMVVCAVSDDPVGIDVEKIRPINLKVAKKICNEEELNYLFGHLPSESDFVYSTDVEILSRFFRLWTKKEAFGKYLGIGLFFENKNEECSEYFVSDIKDYIVALCTMAKITEQ